MVLIFLVVLVLILIKLQNSIYKKSAFDNVGYKCYFSTDTAFEGDLIEFVEEVTNAKFLPVPWFKSDFTTSKWLDFADTQSVIADKSRFVASFFVLKSNHKVVRKWKVKCLKRGVFEVDKVTLVASDLFGNLELSKPIDTNVKITVLPNPLTLEEIEFAPNHLLGDVTVRQHLTPDPFYINGIREYTDRDPINKISWTATAKEKKLMVYENAFTTSPSVAVVLNIQSREFEVDAVLDEENVENCIKVCAGYLYNSLKTGTPIKFISNTSLDSNNDIINIPSSFGLHHIDSLMHILASLPLKSSMTLRNLLNISELTKDSTDIILITSFISNDIIEFARNRLGVKVLCTGYLDLNNLPDDIAIYPFYDFFKEEKSSHEN